ncbi:MAG: branched-chain amino acid transporter permease [Dialister invisus]
MPAYIQYLGKALPSAVFALLVVYSLKDIHFFSGNHGVPEALSLAVTVAVHVWREICFFPWRQVRHAAWR